MPAVPHLRITLAVALICVAGCSTKNYGRQPDLTEFETKTMTCREIDLEQAKVQGFIKHVDQESEFDGRSVLSFLGDFGVGNVMEKDSAMESATSRLTQLGNARAAKDCFYATAEPKTYQPPSTPSRTTGSTSERTAQQKIEELQQEKGITYEEYQYRYKKIMSENQ